MHRLSVPLHVGTLSDADLPRYLKTLRACGAFRVFLCGLDYVYEDNSLLYTEPDRIARAVRFFKDNSFEVGIWISPMGHGSPLSHDRGDSGAAVYTPIHGIEGEHGAYSNCPRDERFAAHLCDAIKRIAALGVDLIMLDDDLRMNSRRHCYRFGCFCPRHLKEYYERIGETVPREQLEALMMPGGENRYRSAYLRLMGDTMLDLAHALRRAVNEVNPAVRLGFCAAPESWDFGGSDPIELSRAFAGDTEPFFRTLGAPYWNVNVISAIESTRMQFSWASETGIEAFAEGDTYPRPRYNVPSKPLELFDLALEADGQGSGILAYMFDYTYPFDYEKGYADRYLHNAPLREGVRSLFAGKRGVGVRVFNVMHKLEKMELPEDYDKGMLDRLINSTMCPTNQLLSANSIPTSFDMQADGPVMVAGENARYIAPEQLLQGAILDAVAADILMRRGIDTGLVKLQKSGGESEYYEAQGATVYGVKDAGLRGMTCDERARVLSRFLPDRSVSAYTYQNGDGVRFFVLGCDLLSLSGNYASYRGNNNFYNNYYRQEQLVEAIEWVGGAKLPAVTRKSPNLYLLAASDGAASSVLLLNVSVDDVLSPTIRLDRAYTDVRFVGCDGRLEGDTVYLSDISPYGKAAFEVR